MSDGPILISAADAAQRLGLRLRVVYELVKLGQVPDGVVMRYGRANRRLYFVRPRLEEWLTARGLTEASGEHASGTADPVSRRVVCPECGCETLWVPGKVAKTGS